MPAYDRGLYYPVKLGDVFCSRYQVLSKSGFGANSTVWFCRDLQQHRYIALKIYIHSSKPNHDVQVLEHLAACRTDHPGKQLVRNMIDSFEITGPKGSHQCVVQDPLLTSLLHFQATLNPMSLTEALIKGALQQLLLALDFLHTEAHVVHTDIQAKNIIIESSDPSSSMSGRRKKKQNPHHEKPTMTWSSINHVGFIVRRAGTSISACRFFAILTRHV